MIVTRIFLLIMMMFFFLNFGEGGVVAQQKSPFGVGAPQAPIPLGGDFLRENLSWICLLYTSPSPRDLSASRMPSSA